MTGYNSSQQALYFAVSLVDDDYIQSPQDPAWNLHDLQVLYLDVKHIAEGSGVIAFAHCEYVREIVEQDDLSWYPEVAEASWDQVDVQIARKGNRTSYEWKISLGPAVTPGSILGFDYVIFDKDQNRDSRQIAWGEIDGTRHFNNQILGDLVLVDPDQPLARMEGQVQWKNEMKLKMPDRIRFISETNPQQWVKAGIDSLGTYEIQLPGGIYQVSIPQKLVTDDEEIFKVGGEETSRIEIVAGNRKTFTHTVVKYPKPDLLPQKGILHDFDDEKAGFLDQFIDEYREYFGIPGVSLALIKNGKVVYHQTYGWQNNITKEPVTENSLFEAASITKPVFAFIVLRLVEKGIIDLDKPPHEYLPFDELERSPDYKLMTGRHVLIHQSGLPNWGRNLRILPVQNTVTPVKDLNI